ncbi:hypothetical protein LIER_22940 [Lithospermum erythrorhizon]|uniref:Uncharacterized protein n=1 Tax=Lithospermum erythrorhizon TaxID=34254 RepID=A0AAV3R1C6_LITER
MAIPQEVADNIARTVNDAPWEGSLPFTEVLSAQPLAVRNTETAQANPASTPSSTPAAPPPTSRAGASQPGTSSINTCDPPLVVPTVIRNSLPVPFSFEDSENFREYFSIPPSVEMRLPVEGDTVFESRVDPSHTEDDVLNVAQQCVEPKEVPFLQNGGRTPAIVRKSKVWKVPTSSNTPTRNEPSPSTAVAAATSTSTAEKRPAPEEGRPKVFAPSKKHAA